MKTGKMSAESLAVQAAARAASLPAKTIRHAIARMQYRPGEATRSRIIEAMQEISVLRDRLASLLAVADVRAASIEAKKQSRKELSQ